MSVVPRKAVGTLDPSIKGVRQIAIRFPTDVFEKIASDAERSGLSFAQRVRQLCERAMAEGEKTHGEETRS